MAEVAGLVLGVVGIVGIIGAFKDTIELFSIVAAPRDFSRDYEIASIKLDIEKLILLQWADRVRLLEENYDKRLDDIGVERGVIRVLHCAQMLMSDAQQLTKIYGLREVPSSSESTSLSVHISSSRMEHFVTRFKELKIDMAAHQARTPMSTKFRWVIKDKDKFEGLITELAHFTAKLDQLIPPLYHHSISDPKAIVDARNDEDLQSVADLHAVEMVLDAAVNSHKAFAERAEYELIRRKEVCQNRILDVIWFRMIDDRRDSVKEAHIRTLDWTLRPPDSIASWSDMSKWFLSGSGIYWVCGKAGSGKSTLMKYLLYNAQVTQLLSKWSAGNVCIVGSFFFLNLGSPLQKSQEGLSRSVLYQLLSACPELIPEMLPNLWKAARLQKPGETLSLPTTAEIVCALDMFGKRYRGSRGFCLFIDGIDELDGDYMDSISFLGRLTANKHVKAVVSSRPIPECVMAFGELPRLRLEDLNRVDISAYVQDTIAQHRYMQKVMRKHTAQAAAILYDLVDKSAGVFLWVILACKSLISGFADYDQLEELRRRMEDLPPELGNLFDHMMGKIKKRHQEQGAMLLRTFYVHKQQERTHGDQHPISAVSMAETETTSETYRQWTVEERSDVCKEVAGRLRSRSGGLLELQLHQNALPEGAQDTDSMVVEFMHRSVFEFLEDPKVWNLPSLRISDESYVEASTLSILKLHGCIRSLDFGHEAVAWSILSEGLNWGARADHQKPGARNNIFWELEPFLAMPGLRRLRGGYLPRLLFINAHDPRSQHSHASLLLGIERGAVNFVKRHIALPIVLKEATYPCSCVPLYRLASSDFVSAPGETVRSYHATMLKALLEAGANPNLAVSPGEPPWHTWLSRMVESWQRLGEFSQLAAVDMTISFLEAGASLEYRHRPMTEWIPTIFSRENASTRDPKVLARVENLIHLVHRLEK
jgi:hypothetical protein